MAGHPKALAHLIDELEKLPGIGTRSAERIAFSLVRSKKAEALELARAIRDVKEQVFHCRTCFNFASEETCPICADPERDRRRVMVVEQPRDVVSFEDAGRYRGTYHVLMGHVSPHDGTALEHLAIGRLLERIDEGGIDEVILGTNPDAEGDGTALAVARALAQKPVKVTRLARGLSSGFSIAFAGTEVLADALEGRVPFPVKRSR
jgi:recombination protein RecR